VERVIEVVEIFDKAGFPFLGYQHAVPLSSETTIELSHESLIDIWDRLRHWVDEEDESITMYLRLSRGSALYQQGKGALLEADELQKALDWKKQHNPTPAWGIQFNPAFERAMVFLNTSEEEYIWIEKRKIQQARRKRILNRSIAIGGIVITAAVALIIYISRSRPVETDLQIQSFSQEELPSTPSFENQVPDPSQPDADEGSGQAQDIRGDQTVTQESEGEQLEDQGEINAGSEETAAEETASGETPIEETTAEVRTVPEEETTDFQNEAVSSVSRENEIIISIARDAAYLSLGISRDPELKGLLAYQSYQLNREHEGAAFDPDIYKGLYEARKKLISAVYNIYPNLRNSVKAMEWLGRSGSILVASSDGSMKILSGNVANKNVQTNLVGTGLNNECLGISPDERIVAVGTNGGGLLFLELENRGERIHQNTEQGDVILAIENLGRSGSFLSIGIDSKILKWDYNSFTPEILVDMMIRPISLSVTRSGSRAAIGTSNGRVYIMDVNNPASLQEVNSFGGNQARVLEFSPDQQYLAAGMRDGSVKVLSANGRSTIANLFGPGARVTALEFSPDGRFLVAASNDGNVYLWNAMKWDDPPVGLAENCGFVLSLCFSNNGKYFYSGSVDFPRMVGRPVDSDQMASGFCTLLTRNLTREEWNQYFGEDLPYQETCPR
jgi:Tol biopolymer transport system component